VRDCNGFCVGSRGCDRGYFGKGGARIVIKLFFQPEGSGTGGDLCRSAGGDVVVVQGDVSRDEDCRKIVAAAASWGRLDALINNAGTTKHMPHDNLDGLSAEDFQRLFGVNTIGPFQNGAGRAIATGRPAPTHRAAHPRSSTSPRSAGISGIGSSVAYAASKGALNTITLSLARALAPLIRVNAVCPGYIDTPWFTRAGASRARPRCAMPWSRSALKRASNRGRCRKPGVLPRHAAIKQHDRRSGADGCGLASHYVSICEVIPGWSEGPDRNPGQ